MTNDSNEQKIYVVAYQMADGFGYQWFFENDEEKAEGLFETIKPSLHGPLGPLAYVVMFTIPVSSTEENEITREVFNHIYLNGLPVTENERTFTPAA